MANYTNFDHPSLNEAISNKTHDKIQFYLEASRYFVLIMIPIFIFGIVSNLLLLITINKCKRFNTPSYILSANMAISDIILLSTALIFFVINSFWLFNVTNSYFKYQKFLCRVNYFMLNASFTTSSQSLMAISIDRYLTITHLDRPSPFINRKFLNITILLTWIIGLTVASPFMVITNVDNRVPFMCDLAYSDQLLMSIYLLAAVTIGYPVPLTVVTILYYKVMRRIQSKIMRQEPNITVVHRRGYRQINATKIMFIATFLFMSNSLPFSIIWLAIAIVGKSYIELLLSLSRFMFILISCTFGLGIMNALQNPIIFIVYNQSFRRAAFSMLRKYISFRCTTACYKRKI